MNTIMFYLVVLSVFISVQIIHTLGSKNRLLEALRFEIKNPFFDVVVPFALAFVFVGTFSQIFRVNIVTSEYPIHLLIFYVGLLAPISEEIIFCGILMGIPLTALGIDKNRGISGYPQFFFNHYFLPSSTTTLHSCRLF